MSPTTYRSVIGTVAKRIGDAIDKAHTSLVDRRVEHEPALTDRMLGRIEASIEGLEIKGIQWSAKTLTDRGGSSQESKNGADFIGVLHVDLPDCQIKKGFLAQAKLIRRNGHNDYIKLYEQCRQMLDLSPASYVFLYSDSGVDVVSAIGVVAAFGQIKGLEKRSATQFFKAHLQCFLGDQKISAASPDQLIELADQVDVDRAISISATTAW